MIHKKVTHFDCEVPYCAICEGGLFDCEVCRCVEASLPTDCPGRPVSDGTQDLVAAGRLDFIRGEWFVRSSDVAALLKVYAPSVLWSSLDPMSVITVMLRRIPK